MKTRSTTSTATGFRSVATATATCPKATRATGGGFVLPAQTSSQDPFVFESQKVGQRSWRVSAQWSTGSLMTLSVTSLVYCREGAPKTIVASATVPTPAANQRVTANAACPGHSTVQAGGFSTPPPITDPAGTFLNRVTSSSRSARLPRWNVGAQSTIAGASTLTSFAYCAKWVEGTKPHVAVGAPVTSDASPTAVTASCPPRRQAVAGGFAEAVAPGSPSTETFLLVNASRRVGRAWRNSAVHFSASIDVLLSVVYCAR